MQFACGPEVAPVFDGENPASHRRGEPLAGGDHSPDHLTIAALRKNRGTRRFDLNRASATGRPDPTTFLRQEIRLDTQGLGIDLLIQKRTTWIGELVSNEAVPRMDDHQLRLRPVRHDHVGNRPDLTPGLVIDLGDSKSILRIDHLDRRAEGLIPLPVVVDADSTRTAMVIVDFQSPWPEIDGLSGCVARLAAPENGQHDTQTGKPGNKVRRSDHDARVCHQAPCGRTVPAALQALAGLLPAANILTIPA